METMEIHYSSDLTLEQVRYNAYAFRRDAQRWERKMCGARKASTYFRYMEKYLLALKYWSANLKRWEEHIVRAVHSG